MAIELNMGIEYERSSLLIAKLPSGEFRDDSHSHFGTTRRCNFPARSR